MRFSSAFPLSLVQGQEEVVMGEQEEEEEEEEEEQVAEGVML